jgi:tetratricopeptide (TPR) repeat protein
MTENPHSLSIRELFDAGNYATVAMTGGQDQWRTYAAMGLVGKGRDAIEGLRRFDGQEARFYSAVASWIDGDEATAIATLQKIPTPYAQNLLTLIRKPKIHVLAQLPWTRQAPHDLLTAAAKDNKFRIQNISFHRHDLPNKPYANIHTYYDPRRPPDFYVCTMVEWHIIPPNLQELPCPIIGQTSDYDAHIQTLHPWLQLFDEFLVTDQTEWQDVRRLVRVPVSTFPKSFGISDTLPPVPAKPRKIDVFVSGSAIHPYHPDKVRLLNQTLRLPDRVGLWIVPGFVPSDLYNQILGISKVSFCYVRHSGGMPTRGLEALSMGCAVVVQKGCVLTLYAGEEEGVLTYEFDKNDLAPGILRMLNQWSTFERGAQRGAKIIRREFGLSRVASQYLRFLTFVAARPRGKREMKPVNTLAQKRSFFAKGLLPGGPGVLQTLRQTNLDRWQARLKTEGTLGLILDMAREMVLEYAASRIPGAQSASLLPDGQLLEGAFELYRKALHLFPQSLVLRFNLIRTSLHFGQPRDVSEALDLAKETLEHPESAWQIDPMEDVFPLDFFSVCFNYRRYLDRINEHVMEGKSVQRDLVKLILASLLYYLSHYSNDPGYAKRAAALDPEFSAYTFRYAQQLIHRGWAGDLQEAVDLLVTLAEDTTHFVEALQTLQSLQARGCFNSPASVELKQVVAKLEISAKLSLKEGISGYDQDWRAVFLQPAVSLLEQTQPRAIPSEGATPAPGLPPGCRPEERFLVSALVPVYEGERFMRGLLEDLEAQTCANRMEIVIVDTDSPTNERAIVEEFQRRYDNIVYVRTGKRENSHTALNRCIDLARGKYLTSACVDDRHKADAYERMVAVLEARPDIALVYGNSSITVTENETFEKHTAVEKYRWADFDPLHLLYGCYMGPQPMWRKNLHERYGWFDESLASAGDWDFWLRMAKGETFLHIDEFLGLYLYSQTSSEHRDPELSRREVRQVQQRYIHRDAELREKKKRAQLKLPAASGILVLVMQGDHPREETQSCVERVRGLSSPSDPLFVKVVRAHPRIPENDLGVMVSPGSLTALEALCQGVLWEARYVMLLSPDVALTQSCLDHLLSIAESEPAIAAVGPTSQTAPGPQRVEGNVNATESNAQGCGNPWKDVPCLGCFCLLLKSQAVRQVGTLCDKLSLPMALWDLFCRFHARGLNVACAEGVFLPHPRPCPEDGALEELHIAKDRLAEAEAFFHEGRFHEAEESLREILQHHPEYADAHNDLACLLWETGRGEEALQELLNVMEVVPNHRDAVWNLGQFLKMMGKDRHASEIYSNYLKDHPEEKDIAEALGHWEGELARTGEPASIHPFEVQEIQGG